jgi:hypothetical protein
MRVALQSLLHADSCRRLRTLPGPHTRAILGFNMRPFTAQMAAFRFFTPSVGQLQSIKTGHQFPKKPQQLLPTD